MATRNISFKVLIIYNLGYVLLLLDHVVPQCTAKTFKERWKIIWLFSQEVY